MAIRVLFTLEPEEALEVADALKSLRKLKADKIIRPLKRPTLTVGQLAEALQSVGITDAKLVQGMR